jgi:hypothetical protein
MATRFESSIFSSAGRNWKIYIDDADFVGTAYEFRVADFRVRWDGEGKSRNDRIKGSKCDVEMMIQDVTHEAIIADLIDAPEGRFTMKITYVSGTEQFYWAGYILSDLSGGTDEHYPYSFRLTATDGLARLRDIEYKDDSGASDVPFGRLTFIDHILGCLNQDGLSTLYFDLGDIFLTTTVNWQETGHGTPAASKCPLAHTRVHGQVWAKQKGDEYEFLSCYDVLLSILDHWDARLMFSGGRYRIQQVNVAAGEFFRARSFDRAGDLVSSASADSYDKTIDQTIDGAKMRGVQFAFLPPLKRVEVTYDHKTARNYLEGQSFRWKTGGVNDSLTLADIDFDANSYLHLTGRFRVKVTSSEPDPWRFLGRVDIIASGGEIVRRLTQPAILGQTMIGQDPATWNIAGPYAEATTGFVFPNPGGGSTTFDGYVDFGIITPAVPSGTDSLTIDFAPLGGEDWNENTIIYTLDNWAFENLVLRMLDATDANNFMVARKYFVDNTQVGNSETVKVSNVFGHPIKPWTPGKLEVSVSGTVWADASATWKVEGGSTSYEFGNLLAAELLTGQAKALRILQGRIIANSMFAHSRIITTDGTAWILMRGEYLASMDEWSGEWLAVDTDVELIDDGGEPIDFPGEGQGLYELVVPPSSGVTNPSELIKFDPANNIAMNVLSTNGVATAVLSGAVTSIDLTDAVVENAYSEDDVLWLVHPETGALDIVTVTATSDEGDTTVAVSGTLAHDYPVGSWLVYLPKNDIIGGKKKLPVGTHRGDILWWDETIERWIPYSGTTVGHVLTWDNTNGWQSGAASGVSDGDKGDIVVSSSGTVWTIDTNAVSNTKFRQSVGLSVVGRSAGTTGNIADITATGMGQILHHSGTDLIWGFPYANTSINVNDSVRLLGRYSGGAGLVEEIEIGAGLSMNTTTGVLSVTVAGTVTSVALSMPAIFSVAGSPVTSSGTFAVTLASQAANLFFVSPNGSSGAPTFRALALADLANDLITYAKIQNVSATSRILGRITAGAGDIEELTGTQATTLLDVFTSGLKGLVPASGGGSTNFLRADGTWAVPAGSVSGGGAAGRVAYWSGASALTSDADFTWDATLNQLLIGGSNGTNEQLKINANASGNVSASINNAWNASGLGGALLTLAVGGVNAGDATLQWQIIGVMTWSAGVDNSDSDKFKIKPTASPSTGSNTGITISATGNTGFRNDNPIYAIDALGVTRSNAFAGRTGETLTISLGTGAGTGALQSLSGGQTAGRIQITMGTTPTVNATVFTFTYATAYPTGSVVVLQPANAAAATDYGKFYISAQTTTSFTVTANGTLSASPAVYQLNYHVIGF